jgi:hypothetical protein
VPPPRDNPALLAALETAARRHLSVLYRSALDVAANAAACAGTAAREAAFVPSPSSPLSRATCVRAALAERDAAVAACDAALRRAQAAEDALRDVRLRVTRLELEAHLRAHDGSARTPRQEATPSWLLPPSQQQRAAVAAAGRQLERRRSSELAAACGPPPCLARARAASAGHSRPVATSGSSAASPASAPNRGRVQRRDWSRTLRGGSGGAPAEALLAFTPHSRHLAVPMRNGTPASLQLAHVETPAWSAYEEQATSSGERSARMADALAVR